MGNYPTFEGKKHSDGKNDLNVEENRLQTDGKSPPMSGKIINDNTNNIGK
jgi:hypothetical protein